MSKSPEAGFLVVKPPAGVGFRILDSEGSARGAGAAADRLELMSGLYGVQWLSGGIVSETVVRVSPDIETFAEFPREPVALSREAPAAIEAVPIGKALRPSEQEHGAQIAIVVAGTDRAQAAVGKAMRLFDMRDVAMRAAETIDIGLNLDSGEFARCYKVKPGRFCLSYTARSGETLQQAVPAIKGRQTIVFLEAAEGANLVAENDGFVKIQRIGIDPRRTVMISVAGNESDERIRERIRLMRLLLNDLGGGGAAMTEDFAELLGDGSIDPLLRLAGTLVVLSRLEAGRAVSMEEVVASNELDDPIARTRWMGRVKTWLPRSGFSSMPADVAAAWWQLERLGRITPPKQCPRVMTSPPMMNCAWRWVSAISAAEPARIRSFPALIAAARSTYDAEPWLCWMPAAAKAFSGAPRRAGSPGNEALAQAFAGKLDPFFEGGADRKAEVPRRDLLDMLDPELAALVLLVRRLSLVTSEFSLSERLAAALGLPGKGLHRRIERAIKALEVWRGTDNVNKRSVSTRLHLDSVLTEAPVAIRTPREEDRKTAPGLTRQIIDPDDPQLGRFGKLAQRRGFRLDAMFKSVRGGEWTRIKLVLSGPAASGDKVQFYLHDSFHPQLRETSFRGGVAQLQVLAWGGFTVGAWLPMAGVELELNLAKLPQAPANIRFR